MVMTPDQKRVETFLSYKGFHWEPLVGEGEAAHGALDFRANRQGEPCFRGTVISIGNGHRCDEPSVTVDMDEPSHKRQHLKLTGQLKGYLERDRKAGDDPALPAVVVIVNHELCCCFEDLSDILATLAPKDLTKVHLFVWFDDFKDDRMLFCQTDPVLYQQVYNWFHVE